MTDAALISNIQKRYQEQVLPPMVIFDVTNVCNLKCIHCPQPIIQEKPDFSVRQLDWNDFTKAIDEIGAAGHTCLVRLAGDGEPLLHRRLVDMIQYAKSNSKAVVNLTTNGITLGRDKADAMLEAGIDLIDFSIDALTKPTYEIVRKGGIFENLMTNIFYMLSQRKKRKSKTKIMVSFVEQNENASEMNGFREYWKPLVDYVLVRQLHSAVSAVSEEKLQESQSRNHAHDIQRYPCPHLWKRLTIDFAGNIKFCAHDWGYAPAMILGNMKTTTLSEIWKGEKLGSIRREHETGRFSHPICGPCTDWASSRWEYGYERLVDNVVFNKNVLMPDLPLLPGNN